MLCVLVVVLSPPFPETMLSWQLTMVSSIRWW